jgi:eukaryotic-like serine/threonine-protein kinase
MNSKLRNSFLFNLFLMFLLCAGLYFIFFSSLSLITRHKSEARVPNVLNKNVKIAAKQLERLGFDVEVDSSYDPKAKPLMVLGIMPDIGSVVKQGRTIFLTVNKAEPPLTPMPKLTDLSYRSAIKILESARLVLGDTTHKPDYAKGAVLEQLYKGRPLKAGDMVPQGSRIDLVIGDGFGSVEMDVPDVIGMTAGEGITILNSSGLNMAVSWEAPISDSSSAIIFRQTPAPFNELDVPNRIKEGDVIDVFIKQNPSPEELDNNRKPTGAVNSGDQNPTPQ